MIYTKEEFKTLWEADDQGSGITFEDIAECAKEWRLFNNPKCSNMNEVLDRVLKTAGCTDSEESSEQKKNS